MGLTVAAGALALMVVVLWAENAHRKGKRLAKARAAIKVSLCMSICSVVRLCSIRPPVLPELAAASSLKDAFPASCYIKLHHFPASFQQILCKFFATNPKTSVTF